jgi:hypothetical protein
MVFEQQIVDSLSIVALLAYAHVRRCETVGLLSPSAVK